MNRFPGVRPLWIAGRFLTRFPLPDPGAIEPAELGQAVPWYPWIGLLLGLVISGAALALGPAVLNGPSGVAAALVLALWVWSTGGLHLDGLADTADAWVGGLGSRERTLAIMKDPTSGPAGVSALALVLIAKFAAIEALIGAGDAWLLLWVPLIARAQLPLLLLSTPYARPQGMAADPARTAPPGASRLAIVLAAGVVWFVLGWTGLLLLSAAGGLYWLVRRSLMARLGGFTGDTAGALVELTEALVLLLLALGCGAGFSR
ncbi:adenosylcobinamide-GDP ribazoletransferase [uncultured Lamprocystis sp.]|jgi:adenosylcobinamide-GDP ribazoletransferase|uniref:adenosylcobinamide-GDP ribazoletransferase n=1 Tax=uncultured Lamprocystis sp. TaxID=543132 RepID=UPI0025FA16C3|nr:adenosylcobinamide-GDP ribazoletransferase [uncultured Lamprocystis sp.]